MLLFPDQILQGETCESDKGFCFAIFILFLVWAKSSFLTVNEKSITEQSLKWMERKGRKIASSFPKGAFSCTSASRYQALGVSRTHQHVSITGRPSCCCMPLAGFPFANCLLGLCYANTKVPKDLFHVQGWVLLRKTTSTNIIAKPKAFGLHTSWLGPRVAFTIPNWAALLPFSRVTHFKPGHRWVPGDNHYLGKAGGCWAPRKERIDNINLLVIQLPYSASGKAAKPSKNKEYWCH